MIKQNAHDNWLHDEPHYWGDGVSYAYDTLRQALARSQAYGYEQAADILADAADDAIGACYALSGSPLGGIAHLNEAISDPEARFISILEVLEAFVEARDDESEGL